MCLIRRRHRLRFSSFRGNAQPVCDRPIVRPPIALGIAPTLAPIPHPLSRIVREERVAEPPHPGDPDERHDHRPVQAGKPAVAAHVTLQRQLDRRRERKRCLEKSLATSLKRKRRALNDMYFRTPFACASGL